MEIVSRPDMASPAEAGAYVRKLRSILRYVGSCDGNMEEGSMRADVNVSVRKPGDEFGTRTETKNVNSVRFVMAVVEQEARRQVDLIEDGGKVVQETRLYDPDRNETRSMRSKEDAHDYRYFPDPDLPPFVVTDELLNSIREAMPPLPEELVAKYTDTLHLPEYDARVICDDAATILYFELLTKETPHTKAAANWLLGPVKSYLNDQGKAMEAFTLPATTLAALIDLVDSGKVNFSIASSRILPVLIEKGSADPMQVATGLNLIQNSDASAIAEWVDEVLLKMPDKVTEYRKGKKGLIGLFMGEVKKLSKGKADPKVATQLLTEKLEQH
jgi:aspartyl-tRNA(Asn)/glutamyl-tRNA(Gln) amidotransferase subunit B